MLQFMGCQDSDTAKQLKNSHVRLLTLCDPEDCGPLGSSSVHGILQARILEWVAISFSRDLPYPGIEPRSPTLWADALTSEPASHEIKKHLLLGRKVMTNLDSIFKSRDNTLPTKVCLVKAMVFPVVIYGCESWTVKKAERRKIDAFELWCWRTLLRVPWTGHLTQGANSLE